MFKRTVVLEVRCSQAQAFSHIAREFFENHPRWDPDIVELTRTSPGAVGEGTTGTEVRAVNGRRFTSGFRVSRFEPESAFAIRGTEGGVIEDVDYLIDADRERSRVTLTVDIRARTLLMRILSPLIRRQVERNFTVNVARFEVMLNELAAAPEPLG